MPQKGKDITLPSADPDGDAKKPGGYNSANPGDSKIATGDLPTPLDRKSRMNYEASQAALRARQKKSAQKPATSVVKR
jgi:hypothetical protein